MRRFGLQAGFAMCLCLAAVAGQAQLVPVAPLPREAAGAPEAEAMPIAGEVLDTAIEECQEGHRENAMALFAAIRNQLAPPPALQKLIERYEASGCGASAPRRSAWSVQVGSGYDSNATQGITARSLILGSGPNAVELALDDRYLPRASAFVQGTVDYRRAVGASSVAQVSIGHRANAQTPDYDLTTVAASGQTGFSLLGQRASAQLEWAESWLGGTHYQHALTGGMRWLLPAANGAWVTGLSASRLNYLTQSSQDALQGELSLLREWKLSATAAITGGGALVYDKAIGARPGGDRRGAQYQVGAQFLQNGWTFRPFFSYLQYQSRDVFSPGLIDERRRNRLAQLVLEVERPLTATSRLVLQWRDRDSRDTIALYRYRGQMLSLFLRWDPP